MSKKIKVSLIGAGRIGLFLEKDKKRIKPATHFGMWIKEKRANLTSICDKNIKSFIFAKKIKKNFKFYKNLDQMLKIEKPNIVSISTWKDSHYAIAKKCMESNVKVIVLEKPMATTKSDGKKLLKLEKKFKAKIIVNHRRRFDEEIIKLQKKIEKKIIGEIKKINVQFVFGLQATGTHVIDTLRMLFTKNYGEVTHVIGIESNKKDFRSIDDYNIEGSIFFSKGLIAQIQILNIKDYDIFDFNIFGSKGKITISNIGRSISINKIIKSPEHSGFTELNDKRIPMCKSNPRPQFKKLSENAVKCYLSKSKPLCTGEDSYKALCILEALKESALRKSIKIKVKY